MASKESEEGSVKRNVDRKKHAYESTHLPETPNQDQTYESLNNNSSRRNNRVCWVTVVFVVVIVIGVGIGLTVLFVTNKQQPAKQQTPGRLTGNEIQL